MNDKRSKRENENADGAYMSDSFEDQLPSMNH